MTADNRLPTTEPYADKNTMNAIDEIMTKEVVCIDMDTSVGDAIKVCDDKRIRHLPVVDEQKQLVGIITDRDLRYFISPRIGTISENRSDRESLKRPVHLIMARHVVTASPGKPIPEAAKLMLDHRVGCLPVVDDGMRVVGLVSTSDFIRYLSR